jgi:hypothetical protein
MGSRTGCRCPTPGGLRFNVCPHSPLTNDRKARRCFGVNLPRELGAVWAVVAAVLIAIAVTYSRQPAAELYHVSRSGLPGGLSRVLVELNYPDALIAVAVLGFVAGRLALRLVPLAIVAAALCVVVLIPGVVSQSDLDAKTVNVLPALGVALAFALSLVARTPRTPSRDTGDWVRLLFGGLATLAALPWLAAALGFYLDGVPILGRVFQTGEFVTQPGKEGAHHAVHHGIHHGLAGLLLIITALLLSRLPSVGAAPSLRHAREWFLALMFCYGVVILASDGWLEQVVERGWTTHTIPNAVEPNTSWAWLVILLATPVVWALAFRTRNPSGTLQTGRLP